MLLHCTDALLFILLLAWSTTSSADVLIGQTTNTWGPPPVQIGVSFFSPTSSIRFRHVTPGGGRGCMIYGRDSCVQSCEGHDWHVTASCEVNGTPIPWASHNHAVWTCCEEIFNWTDVEVDLGSPGWFSLDLLADNELHIGYVGVPEWQIWTVGDVPPPFEILYAYPDDQIYHYGGEQVRITAVTRSNWGSGPLNLTAKIRDPWGDLWGTWTTIGVNSFTIEPGTDHESVFSWYTPDNGLGTTEYDLKVELTDGQGQSVAEVVRDDVFNCTHLTEEEIANLEYQVGECWANAQVECGADIVGVAPFADTVVDALMFVEKACQAGELARAGRTEEAWAAGISSLVSFGWVTAGVLTAGASEAAKKVVHRSELVYSAGEIAHSCFNSEFLSGGTGTPKRSVPPGALVDSLAVWYRIALDSTDVSIADALFLEGQCEVRIEADSSYAVMDSTGLIYADIPDLGDSMGVAILTPEARRFESPVGTNPSSEAVFRLQPRADQILRLGLLHRTGADTLAFYRYPELAVTDSTRMTLPVSRNLLEFPIEVDFEGDGIADMLWFPIGQSSAVPESGLGAGHAASVAARVIPNPTRGAAAFQLRTALALIDVQIEIYDLMGRRIRLIPAGDRPAGVHAISWDGRSDAGADVASGLYFYRVRSRSGDLGPQRIMVLR